MTTKSISKLVRGCRRIRPSFCCLKATALCLAVLLSTQHFAGAEIERTKPIENSEQDWRVYGGSRAGDRYSSLKQINRQNVNKLQVAWKFDAGADGGLQTNPLIVDRTMFVYSSSLQVIALDAATGKQRWIFEAKVSANQPSRGFSYWSDGKKNILFAGIMDHLYALDPATGHPLASFGEGGSVDLRKNLGDGPYAKNFSVLTTPGAIYKDSIIVGFRTAETRPAPRGDIRSYNVHTGKLLWSFHTVPRPGEPGYETWMQDSWMVTGAANNWAGMVVDEKRAIVFVPTGSAVNDFYGADRIGDNLYANTLLALDANTGKLIWHFQGVHHDIWDRDFPSPPVLLRVKRNHKMVDAVAQTTKQGFVFLFERSHGEPLFPIKEMPFPKSDVPGELSSKTQPVALIPAPFARQSLTEKMLTQRTPSAHASALDQFKTMRSGGLFTPLTVGRPTVVLPGFDGGAEWGGSAVDPRSGVIYINANDLPWTGELEESENGGSPGQSIYQSQCALCHSADGKGSPPAFPSLIGVKARRKSTEIETLIHEGKGRMPSYPNLQDENLTSLVDYVEAGEFETRANAPQSPPKSAPVTREPEGARLYSRDCAICHGDDPRDPPAGFPALIKIRDRLSDQQIDTIIDKGKGRMPPVASLPGEDRNALLRFLGDSKPTLENTKIEATSALGGSNDAARYRFTGYKKFLDPDGYPAVEPPWGTLNAIDLNTGKYLWKVPLGEYPELARAGVKNTGSENYGGPIVTAGGLVIIGATIYDREIRAFHSDTGELLWEAELPYAGTATPSTYMIDGKQYIVIACSGQRDHEGPQGAAYVAFSLQ